MDIRIVRKGPYQEIEELIESAPYGGQHIYKTDLLNAPHTLCSKDGVEVYPFSNRRISEMITKSRIYSMFIYNPYNNPYDLDYRAYKKNCVSPYISPIFIDAQTGSGKTYFIFHTVYPVIHKRGQRLLIFASRTALKGKIKYDAIDAVEELDLEDYTPHRIQKEHSFGDIDIYSYQDLCHEYNQGKLLEEIRDDFFYKRKNYGAIIFDECQFFIADAEFNVFTERIFDGITRLGCYQQCLRIYMTGTADEIYPSILSREKENMDKNVYLKVNRISAFPLRLYHFERNYSYINPHFFIDADEISNVINSSKKDAKWVVFVENEDQRKAIEEGLKNRKSIYIDSSVLHAKASKKQKSDKSGDEELQDKQEESQVRKKNKDNKGNEISQYVSELVEQGTINSEVDVLFATKCLDVGINITNKNVKIVCYLKDKTDFLQTIGRKRVNEGETVDLYIPLYSGDEMVKWINRVKNKKKQYEDNCNFYKDNAAIEIRKMPNPILPDKGVYDHNSFAEIKLNNLIYAWESVLENLPDCDGAKGESIFLDDRECEAVMKTILDWMEIDINDTEFSQYIKEVNDGRKKMMEDILDEFANKELDKETYEEFRKRLKPFDIRKDKRSARTKKPVGTNNVNKILCQVGYKATPHQSKKKNDDGKSENVYVIEKMTQEDKEAGTE